MMRLWFDVEKKTITTASFLMINPFWLWFDVEKKTITTDNDIADIGS